MFQTNTNVYYLYGQYVYLTYVYISKHVDGSNSFSNVFVNRQSLISIDSKVYK